MNAENTVIIPVYNEPQPPTELVKKLRIALGDEVEILIVDDGSTEPVGEVEGAKILRLPTNRGYGGAIKAALRVCNGRKIAIIDADGTYPVKPLPQLLEMLEDHEMVVGARTGHAVEMPILNRLVKGVLTGLASLLVEQRIPDINSGLRVFRRDSAEPYLKMLPNRFSLTTTLTLAFISDGRSVHFEPIDYHRRVGKSHWRPIRDTRDFIITILRTIFLFNPMRVCLPLALFLWLSALGVLIGCLASDARLMDGTISVLALGGLQILVVGLLAEVITIRMRD